MLNYHKKGKKGKRYFAGGTTWLKPTGRPVSRLGGTIDIHKF